MNSLQILMWVIKNIREILAVIFLIEELKRKLNEPKV